MKKVILGLGAFTLGGICGVLLASKVILDVVRDCVADGSIVLSQPDDEAKAEQADEAPCECPWPASDMP